MKGGKGKHARPLGGCWGCRGPIYPGQLARIFDEAVGVFRLTHRGECASTVRAKVAHRGITEGISKMAFKDVTPPAPEFTTWDFDSQGSLEGTYLRREIVTTTIGQSPKHFFAVNGEEVSIWGSVVIETAMAAVPVGSLVRIVPDGVAGRTKLYKVLVDDGETTPAT